MSYKVKVGIGGIILSITFDSIESLRSFTEAYQAFRVHHDTSDVKVNVAYGELPDLSLWDLRFDPGGIAQFWHKSDQFAISLQTTTFGSEPYKIAIFDSNFERGDITIRSDLAARAHYPIENDLLQNLLIHVLNKNNWGVLLHACGVQDGHSGYLFAGVSGAGKSTIAKLWQETEGITLLNDDRIILRKIDDQFMIYGTPWHGDTYAVSPTAVPLKKILILRHGKPNKAIPLKPSIAASKLFVRSFPTFWDAQGIKSILDVLAEVSMAVPCYDFRFVPENGVVDYVRCLSSG